MLAAEHLGWGGLDLSQLILSSFVGYFNLNQTLLQYPVFFGIYKKAIYNILCVNLNTKEISCLLTFIIRADDFSLSFNFAHVRPARILTPHEFKYK